MKKFILMAAMALMAGFVQAADIFEGELNVYTFNNIDGASQNLSSGLGYNGSAEIDYYVTENKMLRHDKTLRYYMLFDKEADKVYIWSDVSPKGIYVPYKDYIAFSNIFSPNERKFLMISLPAPKVYDINEVKSGYQSFGHDAKFYTVRIELETPSMMGKKNTNVTDIEMETISGYDMSEALRADLVYGTDVPGFVTKYRWVQELNAKGLGLIGKAVGIKDHMKGSQGIEVRSIKPQKIDIAVFNLPENVKFSKKSVAGLHGYYKSISKGLKKQKLFPGEDGNPVVTFEVNEDEWSY